MRIIGSAIVLALLLRLTILNFCPFLYKTENELYEEEI